MDISGFNPKMMFEHPDPYPMFAMLRHTMPVFETIFLTRPGWVVSRYDDCLAILKDADGFSSKANAEVGKVMGRTIIEMDGKEHKPHARARAVDVRAEEHGGDAVGDAADDRRAPRSGRRRWRVAPIW